MNIVTTMYNKATHLIQSIHGDRERKSHVGGFTLVELLVVMAVLIMLFCLTGPVIQNAREQARRSNCMQNQRTLATAFEQYETAKGEFPQYNQSVETQLSYPSPGRYETRVGWLPMLFPYLSCLDLWKNLLEKPGDRHESLRKPMINSPVFHCVSSGPFHDGRINYVVNCGYNDLYFGQRKPGQSGETGTANGMFTAGIVSERIFPQEKSIELGHGMKRDEVADGLSQTILLSENLQAVSYMEGDWPIEEFEVGFCWGYDGEKSAVYARYPSLLATSNTKSDTQPTVVGSIEDVPLRIEDGHDLISDRRWQTARPSSNHPGICVYTMVDGSIRTIQNKMAYSLYVRSMTPDDQKAACSKTILSGFCKIVEL